MDSDITFSFEDFRPEKVQSAGNHQCVMAEIDKINKDLQELKDGLVDTSGRCIIDVKRDYRIVNYTSGSFILNSRLAYDMWYKL